MRVLILGIGGVGAMAAWRLALAGHEVIGFEQFGLDHDRGSSYGDSRIVRRVYPDALYTGLMADAYALWDELQAQTIGELFRRAGGVFCGPAQHPLVLQAQAALQTGGVEHEVLDAQECGRRFPAFRLAPDEVAVWEPSMGYARASRCVRTAAQLAREKGAILREHTPISHIAADASGVRVTTQAGEVVAGDRLLITAGPWTGPRLAEFGVSVPLVVTRQAYAHLEPATHADAFDTGRFPVWIDAATNFYGFPRLGDVVPGVKIALHEHGAITTPETVERGVTEADTETIRSYARTRFPWLGDRVVYSKVCLYTNTPTEDFIVDAVPGLPHTFVVGGLSGHGFKFTPLLGQILADLAVGTLVSYDLSRFRITRFA